MANINELSKKSFMDVLLATKKSAMKDTKVADLAIIESISSDSATCVLLSDPETKVFAPIIDEDVEWSEKELVLIIYTNYDCRPNLRKWKKSQDITLLDKLSPDATMHSREFAIMIKIIKEN